MLYSFADLRAAFSSDLLNEAGRLLDSGESMSPDVSRNGEVITSLVNRSGKRAYRVYVRVEDPADGAVVIRSECSCSRRGNCEHAAAVLLRALGNEQGLTGDVLARSLPDTALVAEDVYPANVHQRLLYLLFPDPGKGCGITVETASAQLLKSGGFGSLRAYQPGWSARGMPPRFLLRIDRELLAELGALAADSITDMRRLRGSAGEQLLTRMLETGRCLLADTESVLCRGPDRLCTLDWGIDETGDQYPEFRAEPAAPFVFLLGSPWYIDPASGECGKLETELPGTLLDELFQQIRIAPGDGDQFHAALAKRYPDVAFPSLREIEVEECLPVQPVPCLLFCSPASEDSWIEDVETDLIRLSFDYAGVRLAAQQPSQVLVGDRVLKIQRDADFEEQCANQLMDAGLEWNGFWGDEDSSDSFVVDGDAEAWFDFQVDTLPVLREQGWRIEFDNSFHYRLAELEQWYGEIKAEDGEAWFHTSLGVQVAGERINLLPALVALLQQFPEVFRQDRLRKLDPQQQLIVPLEDGRMLPVPVSRVRNILDTLFELYQEDILDERGRIRLSRIQLARLAELDEGGTSTQMHWTGARDQRALAERLRGMEGIPEVAPPEDLNARLRGYQRQGLAWLQFLREHGLAGVLADDMGLGKTVQTLAHLLLEKAHGRMDRPSLVVAPTSLMVNWRREAARFAPGLRVLTLHGPQRRQYFDVIADYDLVLTTYPLLTRDQEALLQHTYYLLILDEAQVIKNPKTRASRLVRRLDARYRLCLTGTPMENHLGELWSLFDFLLPGLLGDAKQFRRVLQNPIEKQGDEDASRRLARRLRPFMLRRTKQEVVGELPPKTEIVHGVELEGAQRDLYESIRLAMHERVRRAVADQGLGRSHIVVLDALLKLRQVCCDPRLLKLESAGRVKRSAKLEMLMELLPEMIEEGRRVLLFSQFTGMLKLIENSVREAGVDYVKLTGRTRDRATPVERFQGGEAPLFLISLKAGGVGLNLTAADTVIHYDPWWNPAVERQATDRAHRIGQNNPVFVYKLITMGTVEEKIQAMQARKQALADSLFDRSGGMQASWTDADLDLLFEPLA
ncbi:MAG: DEAD/DEAH box helicase [Thiogranum sp.]